MTTTAMYSGEWRQKATISACHAILTLLAVFPDESAAERFAGHFREQGYAASVEFAETVKELPWDVIVVKYMEPSHQGIGDFETALQEVADTLGGRNDGWGCFSEPS